MTFALNSKKLKNLKREKFFTHSSDMENFYISESIVWNRWTFIFSVDDYFLYNMYFFIVIYYNLSKNSALKNFS